MNLGELLAAASAEGSAVRAALDAVFASAPDYVYLHDAQGRYLYASPPTEALLRRSRAELIGKTWRELGFPALVMEPFDADREQVRQTGEPLTNEMDLVDREGVYRRYEYALSRVGAEAGRAAVLAVVRDITQRKQHEEERERLLVRLDSEMQRAASLTADAERRAAELDAVITAMAEAVNLYGTDGLIHRANPASQATFGFDPTGIKRHDLAQRLSLRHPDGSLVAYEDLPSSRSLRGERVVRERLVFTDAQGRERTALVSMSPLLDDGRVAGSVGVWHDTTDLEQVLAELEGERRRLGVVVEQMPDGVVIAEAPTGRIVLMNQRARQLLETDSAFTPTARELLRYPQQGFHPDGRPYIPDEYPLVRSIQSGEVVSGEEMTLKRADGSQVVLSINSGPICGRAGEVVAAVVTLDDITERKAVQQERDAVRQQMLAAEVEKKRFHAELIRAITQGRFCLVDPQEIPLTGECVFETPLTGEESYRMLRERIREAGAHVGMSDADAQDLVLAAGEAATNAVKHGIRPEAAVFASAERVRVRVRDHGPGIRPENLPATLFRAGFSTKVSLGMGYTIMLQLADQLWLSTGPEGTILQIEKNIHPEPAASELLPTAWARL